jgi:hypothetical protein
MDFEAAVAWLDDHLGREVVVSVSGRPDGRTSSAAVVLGELREANREWTVIHPRGGERKSYDIGEHGGFLLIERDLLDADMPFEESLSMRLDDLQLHVTLV